MQRIILLFICSIFFNLTLNAQCEEVPALIVSEDTSICEGNTITLQANLNPAYPVGGVATELTLSDDVYSGVINIGFDFVFYGVTYNQCLISSNNYITFQTSEAGGYSPWTISGPAPASAPIKSIMCPWQDINPGVGGLVRYSTIGTAPNRIFVVEYCNIPMFSCTGMLFTDQIKIYETCNIIETHIASKPLCSTWNSGQAIHGLCKDGSLAHIVPGRNAPTMWSVTNDGYKFTPDPTNVNNYILEPISYNPFLMNVSDANIIWRTTTDATVLGTGSSLTVSPSAATNYTAEISSGGDCNAAARVDTIVVDFNATYFDTLSASICGGETYNFHGETFYTPGQHTVLVSNLLGCDTFFTVNLSILPLPNVEITNTETNICDGQEFSLSATNPNSSYTYSWTHNNVKIPGANQPILVGNTSGKYRMITVSSNGCSDTSRVVEFTVNPAANAVIKNPILNYDRLCIGDTINLEAVEYSNYEYRWTPEKYFRYTEGYRSAKVKAVLTETPVNIMMTAINEFGCKDSAFISLNPEPCCEVLMPSVFSPNGDGNNDFFNVMMQPGQVIVNFQIFDRLGNMVYDNNNNRIGWDGSYLAKGEAPQSTYFYRVLYSCTDGKNYEKMGDVTLVR